MSLEAAQPMLATVLSGTHFPAKVKQDQKQHNLTTRTQTKLTALVICCNCHALNHQQPKTGMTVTANANTT